MTPHDSNPDSLSWHSEVLTAVQLCFYDLPGILIHDSGNNPSLQQQEQ